MMDLLRGALAVFLLAGAPDSPGIELSVNEPGFLSIDGAYYAFGLRGEPVVESRARIAMLGSDGFYLQSLVDIGSCRRADDSPATLAGAGEARLRFADLPLDQSAVVEGLALAVGTSQSASLRIASCQGIAVLHWQSADGDLRCGQRFGFPFQRGECPQLDRLDPAYLSYSGFE